MKYALFFVLILISGCITGNSSLVKGSAVFENFCGSKDFAVLKETGVRVNLLLNDSDLIIAFKNGISGSIVFLSGVSDTVPYSPDDLGKDNFYVLIDRKALDNVSGYCDYSVGIDEQTNDFVLFNTSRFLLYT